MSLVKRASVRESTAITIDIYTAGVADRIRYF